MLVRDIETKDDEFYAISADEIARIQKIISRLYDGTKMSYDERRDCAAVLEDIYADELQFTDD